MVLPFGVYSYGLFRLIARHIGGTVEHKSVYSPSLLCFKRLSLSNHLSLKIRLIHVDWLSIGCIHFGGPLTRVSEQTDKRLSSNCLHDGHASISGS